jgi:hypothetical protein
MCYTQFRMSQMLGDNSNLFSKQSDQHSEDCITYNDKSNLGECICEDE